MKNPFSDLFILDFTHVYSGPYCTMLLADLGDGRIRLTGITAGCGGLEKLWTYGEEAFLKKLTKLADGFDAAHPQQ